MKVKEYLVGRILKLEEELKSTKIKYDQLMIELKETDANCERAMEQLDDYEMEKEHIKQIITCNIDCDGNLYLTCYEDDNKTLQAILDIKPEDYEPEMMGQTFDPDC